MKTIGLLGGMSWESTVTYYQTINRVMNACLGGLHSAKILLHSVDFHEVNRNNGLLIGAARSLYYGGADFLVLCTNTMHKVAGDIEAAVPIPLLHIADATGKQLSAAGMKHVGLLGTKTTMGQAFYRERLLEYDPDLKVTVPSGFDQGIVHNIIFEELCHGRLLEDSRTEYCRIVAGLAAQGAEGVILGCTEIGLLLQASDTPVPLFDTAKIHAVAAAHYALDT